MVSSPLKRIPLFVAFSCAGLLAVVSCNKKTVLVTDTPADYYPLVTGHYIVYRMDSVKFINIGSSDTVISYHAKELVQDSFTDNTGKLSYRVIRYLNDTLEQGEWAESIAYMVTPTRNDVQVVENNLRFIKLVTPVQDFNTWNGNAYIDTRDSPTTFYKDWDYVYANTGLPFQAAGASVDESVTVNESDATLGDSSGRLEIIFSQEIYGKGIGPVYRKFLHSEYQAPNVGTPDGATTGYGLTFNMISHN